MISIIAGILLTGFSILVTLSLFTSQLFMHDSYNSYIETIFNGYHYGYNIGDFNDYYSYINDNYHILLILIVIFSIFLLVIGTSLFLRKANALMRGIFGAALLIIGVILRIISGPSQYDYDGYVLLQNSQAVASISLAIVGGLIFLITLIVFIVKITRNSLSEQK